MAHKFSGFKQGQFIKCEDFFCRPDCAIIGMIVGVASEGTDSHPYPHYIVHVTKDVWPSKSDLPADATRVNSVGFVPMQTSMDWDTRITAVDEKDAK